MWTVLLVGCDDSLKDKYDPMDPPDTAIDTADTADTVDSAIETGDTEDGLVHCGFIKGNETWGPGLHTISCDVEVLTGTLLIQAGATINVADNAGLKVGDGDYESGILIEGTEAEPVVLAAATEEGWSGLWIYGNGSASLSHLTLRGAGDDRRGALHVEGPTVSVDHLSIEDADTCGLKLAETGKLAAGATAFQISGSGGAPVCANLNAVAELPTADSDYTGNTLDQITVTGNDLLETATWEDLGVEYAIIDRISVNGTAELPVVLNLSSGVTMAMAEGTSISFADDDGAAALIATDVLFTGLGAETPGAWEGINFERGTMETTALTNVEIAYAGADQQASLRISSSVILLDGVTVRDSLSAGIGIEALAQLAEGSRAITSTANTLPLYIAPNAVGSLPQGELDFDGNDEDLIELRGDDEVYDSATWAAHGWDYRVDTNISLEGSADEPTILSLDPGVALLFTSDRRMEIGNSSSAGLWAVGTTTDPIYFLPYDAYTEGSWGGILFYSDTVDRDSAIENAEIGYAGGSRTRAGIQMAGASPDVRDTYIHHSAEYGMYIQCSDTVPTGMSYGANTLDDEYIIPC